MKKLIFKDGDKERVIELKDHVNVEEIYYRIFRFQRQKGWFNFNWETVNKLEDDRLHELLPDLQFFRHVGKKRVAEFNWFCHEYVIELGANTITMADKIVKKFHDMVYAEAYTGDGLNIMNKALEAEMKVQEIATQVKYASAGKQGTILEKQQEAEEKFKALLAQAETHKNPYYVPGISGEQKLKFSLWKPNAQRSTANILAADCKEGIPEKVKKMLVKELEVNPDFKYELRMYIAFDYLDSIPGSDKHNF